MQVKANKCNFILKMKVDAMVSFTEVLLWITSIHGCFENHNAGKQLCSTEVKAVGVLQEQDEALNWDSRFKIYNWMSNKQVRDEVLSWISEYATERLTSKWCRGESKVKHKI